MRQEKYFETFCLSVAKTDRREPMGAVVKGTYRQVNTFQASAPDDAEFEDMVRPCPALAEPLVAGRGFGELAEATQPLPTRIGLRPYDWLGKTGRLSHHFISLGDPDDLFDGCFALKHPAPAVLAESEHALGDGALLQFAAVSFLHDQFF
jgi:hypothetical protein